MPRLCLRVAHYGVCMRGKDKAKLAQSEVPRLADPL